MAHKMARAVGLPVDARPASKEIFPPVGPVGAIRVMSELPPLLQAHRILGHRRLPQATRRFHFLLLDVNILTPSPICAC